MLAKTQEEEEELQPFKDNMENFLRQANEDFEDTQEKLKNAAQRYENVTKIKLLK